MRRFLKIFLFLQVVLLLYVFNNSIYNIYEKNNINNSELEGYQLEEINVDDLSNFYDHFMNEYSNAKLQLVKNTVSSTKKSIYKIYSYPVDRLPKKRLVSTDIKLEYYNLSKNEFIDSTGIFYSDLLEQDIEAITRSTGIKIIEYKDDISYKKVFKYNSFNLIVLLFVIQMIYCIYTSYNFKLIGIKKSMGFSEKRIVTKLISNIVKILVIASSIILMLTYSYLIVRSRFNIKYMLFSLLFICVVIIVNSILCFNTIILIRNIKLDEMIKNKTFNSGSNYIMQLIKIVFAVAITIAIASLINQFSEYKIAQKNILAYKDLNGFYTANGFISQKYDRLLKTPKELKEAGDNAKKMYAECESLFCESYSLINNIKRKKDNSKDYSKNYIIANVEYLKRFSDIKQLDKIDDLKDKSVYPTLIVPKIYKTNEKDIKEIYINEYNGNIHYNKCYKIQDDKKSIENINIVYIENGRCTKINTDNGFVDFTDLIILVDNEQFGSLYYLDRFNGGNLFFEFKNLDVFVSKLKKYHLNELVGAGTLLTPYMSKLENIDFVMKNLIMFCIIFGLSLMFLVYMSNYVDIISNKKRYAAKYILGYSNFKILKMRYIIFSLWVITGIVAGMMNLFLTVFIIVGLIDFIILQYMFNGIIKSSICEIEKGA